MEKCDEIIAACAENGVMLSSIFQTRFARAVEAVKQAVDAGRFGIPVYAGAEVCWYRTPAYYLSAPWRGTLALDGGGALMNQAIHTLDLLLYFNGDVFIGKANGKDEPVNGLYYYLYNNLYQKFSIGSGFHDENLKDVTYCPILPIKQFDLVLQHEQKKLCVCFQPTKRSE